MFYAASEIVFWILLAAIAGGGIGYGISQAKSVQLGKRLTESRADAPMERELAIAWDTIEDLNRRLQVAHETIRAGSTDDASASESDPPLHPEPPAASAADDVEDTPEAISSEDVGTEDEDPQNDPELVAPLVHTVERVVSNDEIGEGGVEETDGAAGTRLADRVASASIGNQVEVIKTVEF